MAAFEKNSQKGNSSVTDVHFRAQTWLKKYVYEGNMKV